MEERRSFAEWAKCPIEFSKRFNYVRFQSDRPSQVHQYVGFSRYCRESTHSEIKFITLNFVEIYPGDNGGIRPSEYVKEFWPSWYDKAEHLTEEEVKKIINGQK